MKNYDTIVPKFYIDLEKEKLIKEIETKLDSISIDNKVLQIKSKARSIHSSLAIEANSLSLEVIENIVKHKTVLGNRNEIQEVKNVNEVYERIDEYDWQNENDLLKVHTLMMKYFNDDNGYYRKHGEGVKRGNEIIYTAPSSLLVPSFMKSLFEYINDNKEQIHPLVLSSIFHYYFVYIHPFSDGNGRVARFWVSLILTDWNSKFKYVPIEEEIYLRRQQYYDTIAQCHINGNANVFISFMLESINACLEKTTQKTTQKIKLNFNQNKIVELINENPKITRKELAQNLKITTDGVKYNLKKLVDNNIIERIGADNGGYWKVK